MSADVRRGSVRFRAYRFAGRVGERMRKEGRPCDWLTVFAAAKAGYIAGSKNIAKKRPVTT